MKKSLVLAMAMALGVTASAYAANPFSDVPAGHWAYDSVAKLAAADVVDGYVDGTYGGDKLITRYEMAQIVAKAMAKGANVDKLAAEFADELDTLGVRVAKLEKKADNVKINAQIRAHYEYRDGGKNALKDTDSSKLRTRLWITGQVNEDWSYTGMIQNEQDFLNDNGDEETKFQRAFINGRVGGLKVKAGRDDQKVMGGDILSDRCDMVQVGFGKDVKVTAQYGKLSDGSGTPKWDAEKNAYSPDTSKNGDKYYAVEVAGNIGDLGLSAAYLDVKDQTRIGGTGVEMDNSIWGVKANYKLGAVGLSAAYYKADEETKSGNDDGYIVALNYKGAKASAPGSWGVYGQYRDMAATAWVCNGDGSTVTADFQNNKQEGYEGYVVGANYALAKNIVAQVEYFDLEAKEGKAEQEVIWSHLVFTF